MASCLALYLSAPGCDSDARHQSDAQTLTTTTGTTEPCAAGRVLCAGDCLLRNDPSCRSECKPEATCVGGAGGAAPDEFPKVDGPATTECSFDVSARLSHAIATVGIVRWETDATGLDGATIEYGLDTRYGKSAPVNLNEPGYRTVLLGMKAERKYHFRIVASSDTGVCVSRDYTIDTGPQPGRLPVFDIHTPRPDLLSPGYIVSSRFSGGPAFILDNDGDFVWWFDVGGEISGARMSYDGTHMWINASNVPEQQAKVLRVSMDGEDVEDLSDSFEGQNHQLSPLPDGSVAFYSYGENGCDDIKEWKPDGEVKILINAADAHRAGGDCHLNAIEYSSPDDTLVFSDLRYDNYTKITRDGRVVWVLGGPTSDFSGPGANWTNQHGLHLLSLDRLVFFNNGGVGEASARAVELSLDLGAMTASRVWEYARQGLSSHILGDVERLPNDNTLVVYSAKGVIHEVSPDNQLVQELAWNLGGIIGYAMKRETLYGPPPK